MRIRGVRGAITVDEDQVDAVLAATLELLQAMVQANPGLQPEDVASAIFTTTQDVISVHPARAVRMLGWTQVPLMCAQEIPVPGSVPRVVRILIHWNTDLPQEAVKHVYLREAAQLRPDINAGAA